MGDWAHVAAYEYSRVEIAMLTGWSLEYIDNLSMVDEAAIMQIAEAKAELAKAKR